jgi:hypothetical protein
MRKTSTAIAVLLVLLAGCAGQGGTEPASPDDVRTEFEAYANRIAEAWRTGPAPGAWRSGYVPLQPATVVPPDPGFDDDTKQAFLAGWYRDEVPLPTTTPADGTIRFPDGTLTVPLISAAEAYGQLDQGDPPPCPDRPATRQPPVPSATGPDTATSTNVGTCIPLTVTGAKLGTVTVRTSRGEARVPAWLFTIDKLSGPVARVAVAESAVAPVPSAGTADPGGSPPPNLVTAQDLVKVDGARLTYRLGVGACDRQITPLVAEYPDVVVVAGRVVRGTGVCTDQLLLEPVTATLGAPLGARPVLSLAGPAPLLLTNS